MIRPGYLGDVEVPKPKALKLPSIPEAKIKALKLTAKKLGIKEPTLKPIKAKAITDIATSIKNPIEGVIQAVSLDKPKTIRLQETKILPGMSKEEYLNAPKQQKVIATPEINVRHPLYHDLDALQKKVIEKQKEKIKKRNELRKKWSSRPEILLRWHKEDKLEEENFSNLLKKWEKEDKAKQKKRFKILETKGKQKQMVLQQKWAEKDARERALRAYEIIKKEEKDAEKLAKRAKAQKRTDFIYNLFRRFYGWPERAKPEQ
jgi:hypothetical protein